MKKFFYVIFFIIKLSFIVGAGTEEMDLCNKKDLSNPWDSLKKPHLLLRREINITLSRGDISIHALRFYEEFIEEGDFIRKIIIYSNGTMKIHLINKKTGEMISSSKKRINLTKDHWKKLTTSNLILIKTSGEMSIHMEKDSFNEHINNLYTVKEEKKLFKIWLDSKRMFLEAADVSIKEDVFFERWKKWHNAIVFIKEDLFFKYGYGDPDFYSELSEGIDVCDIVPEMNIFEDMIKKDVNEYEKLERWFVNRLQFFERFSLSPEVECEGKLCQTFFPPRMFRDKDFLGQYPFKRVKGWFEKHNQIDPLNFRIALRESFYVKNNIDYDERFMLSSDEIIFSSK